MEMRDKKGQFVKGHGGSKPKGAKSERLQLWYELKEFILSEGSEKFIEELKKLDGQKYTDTFLKALEYFQPKLSRVETTDDLSREIDALTDEQAEDLLKQLSGKIINQWMQKVN